MKDEIKSYIIVKVLKPKNGKPQHVFLVDSNNELLEFDNIDDAQEMSDLFEANSDRGFKYFVKGI
jgi:hypothetical protein